MTTHPSYTAGARADWSLIPSHCIGGLRRYIENGIEPGSFLTAVLSNNLRHACEYADSTNKHRLFDYCQFLYSYAPSECWGSPERFDAWVKKRGLGHEAVYTADGPVTIARESAWCPSPAS